MTSTRLLSALEKITAAQQASGQRMAKRQEETLTRQLINALVQKIEMAKGDRGERGLQGIPGKTIVGPPGRDGKDGESIRGERGPAGPAGKDGKDADITEVKPIAQKIAEKEVTQAVKKHEKEHDHKLIHNSKMLGKLELDEESVREGAILQIQGNRLIAVDMPKLAAQPYFARAAGTHSRYRIQTVTESTTIDPLMNVIHVDASAGDVTLTFYEAAGNEGSYCYIKRIDNTANEVTFATPSSETIDFENLYMLVNRGSGAEVYSDGSNFFIKHIS